MKVDVVLLTLNSNKPIFAKVMASLYKNVDVNRTIVIDGGSTDGTIEFVKKFPKVEVFTDSGGTRASARELGIKLVKTDWLLFLDSDAVLCENWLNIAEKYISSNTGAVQGVPITMEPIELRDLSYAMDHLKQKFAKYYHDMMGVLATAYTGDTLVRTELLRDVKIPRELNVFEDYYLKQYLERKGYVWVIKRELYCSHYMGNIDRWKKLKKEAIYGGYISYKFGFNKPRSILISSCTIIPKVVYALILKPNFKMAKIAVLRYLYGLIGWLIGILGT